MAYLLYFVSWFGKYKTASEASIYERLNLPRGHPTCQPSARKLSSSSIGKLASMSLASYPCPSIQWYLFLSLGLS